MIESSPLKKKCIFFLFAISYPVPVHVVGVGGSVKWFCFANVIFLLFWFQNSSFLALFIYFYFFLVIFLSLTNAFYISPIRLDWSWSRFWTFPVDIWADKYLTVSSKKVTVMAALSETLAGGLTGEQSTRKCLLLSACLLIAKFHIRNYLSFKSVSDFITGI